MNGRWIAIAAIWVAIGGMGAAVAFAVNDTATTGLAIVFLPIFAVAGTVIIASIGETRTYKVKGKNLPPDQIERVLAKMTDTPPKATEPGAP